MRKTIGVLLILALCLGVAFKFRYFYLRERVGNIHAPNFGGDPCHHFSIAKNIAEGNGPKTDFLLGFWFNHPTLPALTDIYPPGAHLVMAGFMKLFYDDFLGARLASFALGCLTILVLFLVAYQLRSLGAGVVAAVYAACHPTLVENSTIVMTPMICTFFILSSFALLFYSLPKLKKAWLTGALVGFTHLCQGVGPLLLLAGLFAGWRLHGIKFFKSRYLGSLIISFLAILTPWGLMTARYFGKPFFTLLNYYPYIDNWGDMQTDPSLPKTGLAQLSPLVKLLSEKLIPTVTDATNYLIVYPIDTSLGAFCLVSVILGMAFLLKKAMGQALVLFTLLYIVTMIVGSRALGGQLFQRHFVPLIALGSLYLGIGFELIFCGLLKPKFLQMNAKVKKFTTSCVVLVSAFYFVPFSFDRIKSFTPTFWMKFSPSFKETSKWIESNTDPQDRFIFASTPQDLSCLAHRQVIADPSFFGAEFRPYAAEKIRKYQVHYLVIDDSDELYQRPQTYNIEKMSEHYPGFNAHLAYKHPTAPIFVFKLEDKL